MSNIPEEYIKLINKLDQIVFPQDRKIFKQDYKEALKDYVRDIYVIATEMYEFRSNQKNALQNNYGNGPLIHKLFLTLFLGNYEHLNTHNYNTQHEIRNYLKYIDEQTNSTTNIRIFGEMELEYKLFLYNIKEPKRTYSENFISHRDKPVSATSHSHTERLAQSRAIQKTREKSLC